MATPTDGYKWMDKCIIMRNTQRNKSTHSDDEKLYDSWTCGYETKNFAKKKIRTRCKVILFWMDMFREKLEFWEKEFVDTIFFGYVIMKA